MRQLIAFALLLAVGTAEAATTPLAVTRDGQKDVMVTIYNGNLGLVKDTREVRLPAGIHELRFMDVAALIDPTTLHLKSLTDAAGLRILEQNYEYDLLTSQKLIEKYVGRKVRLYQGSSWIEATLLSTNGPVFEINGQIHLGHHGQMVLPALPENLVSKPTLVWLLRNQAVAPQRIEASYLTSGITWKADYVLVLNPGDTRTDLTGWVTIDNKSGATYTNAALKLVAGDLNRARDPRRDGRMMEMAAKASSPAGASRDFNAEGFFEYHLYTLDGRTTIKDNQTKQLTLMAATEIPVQKHFIYWGAQDYYRNQYGMPISNQKVGVYLEIKNGKEHRLGVPLPKGKVRVYKADTAGSQQLIGEDWIEHTPKDERVKLKMGDAFDVVGDRKQTDWKKIASHLWEVEWEVSLRNHKKEPVTVQVIEPVPGDWQVLHATHKADKVEAHTLRFDVPIAKEGAAKLTYRVRIRY
ncbi:MAG TPA: DUF4139 domain-containing protein [Methylomirabilota bacterium]|nr:DUF4139 domain-containing protein [Methylomirabilota bacterium]